MATVDDLVNRSRSPRALANVIMAPSSIVLAGGATAVAVVAGRGPFAAIVGIGAWAAKTLLGIRKVRKPAPEPIDPFRVGEPWRQYVQSAQQSKVRFQRSITQTKGGPLQDHLLAIGERVDSAVQECFAIAKRGYALDNAVDELDIRSIRKELSSAKADLETAGPERQTTLQTTVASIQSRLASAQRMSDVTVSTKDRVRQLDAQLDELVARAIELSISADTPAALGSLGFDVDSVVTEMEALRQAMDETSRLGQGAPVTSPPPQSEGPEST